MWNYRIHLNYALLYTIINISRMDPLAVTCTAAGSDISAKSARCQLENTLVDRIGPLAV